MHQPTPDASQNAVGNPDTALSGLRFPIAGPALTAGFGTTLAVWIAWWLTHLPTLGVPSGVALAVIVAAFVISLTAWARLSPAPVRTGLLAGAVSALLNLLILGSVLGVQVEETSQMADYANRFRSDAPTILLGFTAAATALGLACGFAGTMLRTRAPSRDPGRWLGRFGVVTVVSFFPLLLVGGAVTSTESGMAVPDSFTSYGAFSALLPMSIMAEPRIFLEHTHRLFGTLVGLTAIAQFVFTLIVERRKAPKILAFVLLALVTSQGLLGIVRVDSNSVLYAGVHGVIAQLVLAFGVIVACKLSPLDRNPPSEISPGTAAAARRGTRMTHIAAVALVVQLVFGALTRHSSGSNHALWTHAGFSIVVVLLIVIASAMLRTADAGSAPGRLLRRIGLALTVTVFAQFLLGFGALWQVGLGGADRPIPLADELATAHDIDLLEAVMTTAHQTTGAALLAFITLGVYWSKRFKRLSASRTPPTPGA